MLLQVGELESSKSAMNPDAPEFSALMTILRLVGPVISTRRFCSAAGSGAIVQSPSRTSLRVRQEVERAARVERLLALRPRGQQLATGGVERAVQPRHELQRVRRQDLVEALAPRPVDLDSLHLFAQARLP